MNQTPIPLPQPKQRKANQPGQLLQSVQRVLIGVLGSLVLGIMVLTCTIQSKEQREHTWIQLIEQQPLAYFSDECAIHFYMSPEQLNQHPSFGSVFRTLFPEMNSETHPWNVSDVFLSLTPDDPANLRTTHACLGLVSNNVPSKKMHAQLANNTTRANEKSDSPYIIPRITHLDVAPFPLDRLQHLPIFSEMVFHNPTYQVLLIGPYYYYGPSDRLDTIASWLLEKEREQLLGRKQTDIPPASLTWKNQFPPEVLLWLDYPVNPLLRESLTQKLNQVSQQSASSSPLPLFDISPDTLLYGISSLEHIELSIFPERIRLTLTFKSQGVAESFRRILQTVRPALSSIYRGDPNALAVAQTIEAITIRTERSYLHLEYRF
jgi:hypothetical protein